MASIVIEFDFMMLFHNRDAGLDVYIPSCGHDAKLIVRGQKLDLVAAEVQWLRNGEPEPGTQYSSVSGEGGTEFAHIDRILAKMEDAEAFAVNPRAKLRTDDPKSIREISARVFLPDGKLVAKKPRNGLGLKKWLFKDEKGKPKLELKPTDFVTFEIECDADATYALRITMPGGTSLLTVKPGDEIKIQNPDRPTRDNAERPWYEIRYLYDLLDLPKMRYPIPEPDLAVTPEIPRCSPLFSGKA